MASPPPGPSAPPEAGGTGPDESLPGEPASAEGGLTGRRKRSRRRTRREPTLAGEELVVAFRPAAAWRRRWGLNERVRRKRLVVDARVAFLGGMNISDDSASVAGGGAGWRDTLVRVEGPGVANLIEGFLEIWRLEGGL